MHACTEYPYTLAKQPRVWPGLNGHIEKMLRLFGINRPFGTRLCSDVSTVEIRRSVLFVPKLEIEPTDMPIEFTQTVRQNCNEYEPLQMLETEYTAAAINHSF